MTKENSVVTTTKFKLYKEDILNYLLMQKEVKNVKSMRVSVLIPGGGDWSNEQLEVGEEIPIEVIITEQNES